MRRKDATIKLTDQQKLDALSAVLMALQAKHRASPPAASVKTLAKEYGGPGVKASAIAHVLSTPIAELFAHHVPGKASA